ncbi:hypothetical protein MNBD_GAMMA23-862 [hydrothermal vent metagenome]|uniref:Low-complexity protein n=1 Tax=hydrothermal vent metagenome TaxID=652676 RepID=A0A3B0ZS34_9ZZZZ
MSNKTIKPISIVLGAIFATTLAASNIANASETGANPFAMTNLEGGYQVAKDGKCGGNMSDSKKMDGKCGEGKAMKKKDGKCGEGKCGGNKASKKKDAKCGAGMKKDKAKMGGKCGSDHKKMNEGKCGGH